MPPCLGMRTRYAHMAYCLRRGLPRIKRGEPRTDWLNIVGYGPSLEDTWPSIKGPVLTMSGAHDYLIDRGIVPNWHTDMDPRKHKASLVHPHYAVKYLMATVCHPSVWDRLENCDVEIFHVLSEKATPEWIRQHDTEGAVLVGGGSEIGLAAIHVGGLLGFTKFRLHGFDHSMRDGRRHAGPHGGPPQTPIYWEVNGRTFHTTKIMVNAAIECMDTFAVFPIECEVMGDGLLQEMVRSKSRGHEVGWESGAISEQYREQNMALHANPLYGVGGANHALTVLELTQKLNTQDVLDYGCGKGLLAKALPFPIREYDPAIPGKEQSPEPADLVVCTDVLEHIEPERLEFVLNDLKRCVKKGGYFVVHTGPALKVLPDGRNAHLIQEPEPWWSAQIGSRFHLRCVAQIGPELHYMVEPQWPARSMDQ